MWRVYLLVIFINSVELINQPVYKIALTQKGLPQYLQYDIDTPPIREITLCVWIRIFEFLDEQTIFTYMVHGNSRIIRLWIEDEGKLIRISINGVASSRTAVDLTRDTWHHVCLSYQSDSGSWALYFNGRLSSCDAAQSIYGYKLPAGGQLIFGNGISRNGSANGIEGEIYGINVVMISVIEKNFTLAQDYRYERTNNNFKEKSHNFDVKNMFGQQLASQTVESVDTSSNRNHKQRNFIKFNTPYSQTEYEIGAGLNLIIKQKNNTKQNNILKNKKIMNSNTINLLELLSKNKQFEQSGSHTKELPILSEYETPPPSPSRGNQDNFPTFHKTIKFGSDDFVKLNSRQNSVKDNTFQLNIPDIELPPAVDKKNEVYGQWTTSSFAKDVLNYIKSINSLNSRQRKVPETIPLLKISDQFPYSSDLIPLKTLPPDQFQKRYIVHKIFKRESKKPQINIKILDNDIRTLILEEHAKTYPQNVEITSRGKNKMDKDKRFSRNVNIESSENISTGTLKSHPSISKSNNAIRNWQLDFNNNFVSISPHLKSDEYFIGDKINTNQMLQKNLMYTNSLSDKNIWHNIKFHGEVFSPRDIKSQPKEKNQSPNVNSSKQFKTVLEFKHNPEQNIFVTKYGDSPMNEGISLGTEIFNLSNPFEVAKLSRNEYGWLGDQTAKAVNALKFVKKIENVKNKFHQHVKIGNALNEQDILGDSVEKKKHSFIGENKNIPDIHRYRSDLDDTKDNVPPSLLPKVCKNVEQLDRTLNLRTDVFSDIISQQKGKNFAVDFITANYKCLDQEIISQNYYSLLITWNQTPVRLFGGAYPIKTVKHCASF